MKTSKVEAELRHKVSKLRERVAELTTQRDNAKKEVKLLKAKLWALGLEA